MANAGKTLFAKFTKVRSIHRDFFVKKQWLMVKKVYYTIGIVIDTGGK
jgi:hypothetical protein